jgi:hypothetical protein
VKLPDKPFHAPLHPLDSETQTHGCRQTRPTSCAKHSLPGVCAFVRQDNTCQSPPRTWKRQFLKLFFRHFGKQTQPDEINRASPTKSPMKSRSCPRTANNTTE